jgi:capsular exopolysaccharide synthesis family protein
LAKELSAHRNTMAVTIPEPPPPSSGEDHEGMQVREVWHLLLRNRWMIIAGAGLATAAAVAYLLLATAIYEAEATLRVDVKESNLPGIYRLLPLQGGEIATEMEVLKSRSLAEAAIDSLGLQLVVKRPSRVSRTRLFRDVQINREAPPGLYLLSNRGGDTLVLRRKSDGVVVGTGTVGQPLQATGISLTLADEAIHQPIEFRVNDFEETVAGVTKRIEITQPSRDALIVAVKYQDPDPQLVWQVPTVIAHQFISRRQQNEKSEARSTVSFLREQIDTLSVQLSRSEDQLRRFREHEQVVDPNVEATTQVTRFIGLQADRSAIEAERGALSQLIDEADAAAVHTGADQPSPYRRLLAFPTLLRNQSAADLLKSLSEVEDQRAALLARRTPEDPDVKVLSSRVGEIEEELRLTVTTYLEGLTNQGSGLDSTLSQYQAELAKVPHRQLEFERLQRQPKVLTEMYSLLQTRLKEAEIAQASDDRSVRIVDEAVAPILPISPRKVITLIAALFGGLLLGVAGAFLREFMDRSIHTRSDVRTATGLPVLGLIPRIPGPGRYAVIAKWISRRQLKADLPTPLPKATTELRAQDATSYTFLRGLPSESKAEPIVPSPQMVRIRDQHQVVTIEGIGTAVTEAYGSLQTNILYSRGDADLRTLVFTSALPGDGKTTNATNLAFTLAQRSVKVVLVDADVRRGVLHHLFDVKREPGLTDVLAGRVQLDDALQEVRVKEGGTLHFLTSGRVPANPIALLESPAMGDLLARLANHFDAVILDAPPINMLTDAAVLSAKADGVIIVVRAGVTQSDALEYAMQQLQLVRARVLGVVLNDIDFERDAAYDGAYRYYQYGPYTEPTK